MKLLDIDLSDNSVQRVWLRDEGNYPCLEVCVDDGYNRPIVIYLDKEDLTKMISVLKENQNELD